MHIIEIFLIFALLPFIAFFMGSYMHFILQEKHDSSPFLNLIDNAAIKVFRINRYQQQTCYEYLSSVIICNFAVFIALLFIILLQSITPFNPENIKSVDFLTALNITASYISSCNWQSYNGETELSYFTQTIGLTWASFIACATGICCFFAVMRGITNKNPVTPNVFGNYWLDLIRCIIFILLPLCIVLALILISQGVVQSIDKYVIAYTLEGDIQKIPLGLVATQEAIKLLGVNGGGIFSSNSAHPFENPNELTNLLHLLTMTAIPVGITYAYGLMSGNTRKGWVIFSIMLILIISNFSVIYFNEDSSTFNENTEFQSISHGNMEGKETRFGITMSSLYSSFSSAISGATNSTHDSFTPISQMALLINIVIGGIVFGGAGVGMLGMMVFILISVFLFSLMSGKNPNYLNKHLGKKEILILIIYTIIFQSIIIIGTTTSTFFFSNPEAGELEKATTVTRLLYAFASTTLNNGSSLENYNSGAFNFIFTLSILIGRFSLIICMFVISNIFAQKTLLDNTNNIIKTDNTIFIVILIFTIINSLLVFLPLLILGPIIQYFL